LHLCRNRDRELSRRTECNIERSAFYERIDLLPLAQRPRRRFRRNDSDDVAWLHFIRRPQSQICEDVRARRLGGRIASAGDGRAQKSQSCVTSGVSLIAEHSDNILNDLPLRMRPVLWG
jgi:hypothetical protein